MRLRTLARAQKHIYSSASKKGKSEISQRIVEHIQSLNPSGRFLKKNASTGKWEEVDEALAREKTSQALRDAELDTSPLDPEEFEEHKLPRSLGDSRDHRAYSYHQSYPYQDDHRYSCGLGRIGKRSWQEPHCQGFSDEFPHGKVLRRETTARYEEVEKTGLHYYDRPTSNSSYDGHEEKRRHNIFVAGNSWTRVQHTTGSDAYHCYRVSPLLSRSRRSDFEPLPLSASMSSYTPEDYRHESNPGYVTQVTSQHIPADYRGDNRVVSATRGDVANQQAYHTYAAHFDSPQAPRYHSKVSSSNDINATVMYEHRPDRSMNGESTERTAFQYGTPTATVTPPSCLSGSGMELLSPDEYDLFEGGLVPDSLLGRN